MDFDGLKGDFGIDNFRFDVTRREGVVLCFDEFSLNPWLQQKSTSIKCILWGLSVCWCL